MAMLDKSMKSNNELDSVELIIKSRILLLALLVAIIFILLSFHLVGIVLKDGEEYNKIILSQRQSSIVAKTIQAKRGDIFDTNGVLLATSKKVYNLILDPKILLSESDGRYVRPTVEAISYIFGDEEDKIYDIINKRPNSAYVRYKSNISLEDKLKFDEYMKNKNNEYSKNKKLEKIRGIWFEDEYKRYYPNDSLLSNVIGWTYSDDSEGMFGLESYYNEELSGISGRSYGYLDNSYNLERIVKKEIDGNSIVTTIDIEIQKIIEKHIKNWDDGEIGSKECSVIVMNPNNGEILGMASNNYFNLNKPRDLYMYDEKELYELGVREAVNRYNKNNEEKISFEEVDSYVPYQQIMEIGKEFAYYKNWKNNCIQNTFEPGSTSKIFTVAAGLEENIINENTNFLCEGKIHLTDGENSWDIRCNNRNGHGNLNLLDAIKVSCNMSMAEIGELMGYENFTKYQEIFGFGQKTNIDLPYEADTSKLIYNKETIGRTALATNSFGQNFNCTMIQMISAYASIINGGTYYEPHIVKSILNNKNLVIKNIEKKAIRKTASSRTVNFLKQALYETVETGTGKSAKIKDLDIGGKTGTAEKLPRYEKNYLVSFCGFAPVDNPKYLVYVVIDQPKLEGEEQAKAVFATQIFKEIMIDIENIKDIRENEYSNLENLADEILVVKEDNEIDIVLSNEKVQSQYKDSIIDEIIIDSKKNIGYSSPELIPRE